MEPLGMVIFGLDGRTLGIIIMVLATVMLTAANLLLAKANPTEELPTGWGNPPVAPLAAVVLRGAGAGLAVLGVVLTAAGIGWTIVLVLVVFVPYGAVNVVHNTRVRQARDPRR